MILQLHQQNEHEHVIHAIQAAILNGQSQPWMYEVLALSMEVAGRPQADVQRVLLSLTDFGSANFESMMYSAAYLTRFARDQAALRLYRQASRMAPERPEPYILGLKLARKGGEPDDLLWASAGILEFGWTKNHEQIHREAETAVIEAARRLQKDQDEEGLAALKERVAAAKRRDLIVTLTWNGAADLDLIVEEPGGTVCSFESPDSPGGGIHLKDGYGPNADNCRELYVCPQGVSGNYRLRVRLAWGEVVGRRAQLTITQHAGTPNEKTTRQSVPIEAEDSVVPIALEGGRRTRPRDVATSRINPLSAALPNARPQRANRIQLAGHEEEVLQRFAVSRENSARHADGPPATGAVGFQSVITTVPDGAFLQVQALISPDRRYVRVAVNPVFTSLTDVFTFSFVTAP